MQDEKLKDLLAETAGMTLALARREISTLEKRIAELEARPAFDYTGLHEPGRGYRKGQGVSHGGSVWIAMRDLPTAPGTANSGFQLACKRGRDGRGAR